jgi:DegV family protein with EDD domain
MTVRENAFMPGVHLVTDSSSDVSPEELVGLNVEIVPLTIRFGNEELTDGQDLTAKEFYTKMATSETLPQTACPSPGAFEQAFRRAAEARADSVICLTISSDLSNTFESAQSGAAAFGGELLVHVIDSRTVSSGLGTLTLEAAKAAGGGADANSVLGLVGSLIPRTHVIAALNTLENLKRGGRIGGAKAMLGSVLSIKPLIDISGGVVKESGKARTRRKAMHMLYDRMVNAGEIEHVAVMHGGASDIEEFLELIGPDFPRNTFRLGTLGAVIGTHGGSEIIGVSWIASSGQE